MMADFNLSLALVDFLPVLCTAVGFTYIFRLVSSVLPAQGRIAFLGGLLVITGGFFRALWKLLGAVSNGALDANWMENSLFIFMTPGYVLFAWSIWQASRSLQGKRIFHTWMLPSVLIVLMLGISFFLSVSLPDSPGWKRLLLSVTVIANLLSGILLITMAFRQNLSQAGWLFLVNLVGVFILNGLARLPDQPVRIHWIAEGINLVSWLVFAVAARTLFQNMHANVSGGLPVSSRAVTTK
jgi:hypothetical protein